MEDNNEAIQLAAMPDANVELEADDKQAKIQSRRDPAGYIRIPIEHITDVLFEADRGRFYKIKEIPTAPGPAAPGPCTRSR